MAKQYAEIDFNKVQRVLVLEDSWSDEQCLQWLKENVSNKLWKLVDNVGPGYDYIKEDDSFVAPVKFRSWKLNSNTKKYEPPIPLPLDLNEYVWNEKLELWENINLRERK